MRSEGFKVCEHHDGRLQVVMITFKEASVRGRTVVRTGSDRVGDQTWFKYCRRFYSTLPSTAWHEGEKRTTLTISLSSRSRGTLSIPL